jgi:hypothetical protein
MRSSRLSSSRASGVSNVASVACPSRPLPSFTMSVPTALSQFMK